MNELLPPMTEVKVENTYHLSLAMKYVGADAIVEVLEELRKDFGKMPGMQLAFATAQNERTEMLARLNGKNITLAMRHGFDPETQTLSMEQRKDGVYLVAVKASEE